MKNLILILAVLCLTCRGWANESFFIGNQEGDGEILFFTQIEEGPDGNVYIYDQRLAFIKVFSPAGTFLRKIGGKGQGPGEFQRTDDVSFNFTHDGKLLYFTEFFGGHRWITFMELSGKLHHVLKLKMEKKYAISSSIQLNDGRFLAQASYNCEPRRKQDYWLYECPTALVIISPSGELSKEILSTNHVMRISSSQSGADLPIPHIPGFIWLLLKNNTIAFTEGLSNELKLYDLNGKSSGEIQLPLPPPRPVIAKDLDEWREEIKNRPDKEWFNRFGKVIYKYTQSLYSHKSSIGSISLTPGNQFLVAGLQDKAMKTCPYWLLDMNGKTVKQVTIGPPVYSVKMTRHFIFSFSEDEDENPALLCIPRKGTEVEDLERLSRFK